MATNNHINYIEFKSKDLIKTKAFYANTFGWEFTDYGPNYTSFTSSGIEGGFEITEKEINNGVLVVLYYNNLKEIKEKILQNGGQLTVDIFSFPGGKRFQFIDHSGNELAVWTSN